MFRKLFKRNKPVEPVQRIILEDYHVFDIDDLAELFLDEGDVQFKSPDKKN